MNYTQLFKNLREAKGFTHDALADLVGCHRNTVINVESGRPVKFKTIAELMAKMGYEISSPEAKSIALLWLEAISGINLTQENISNEAHECIARYRASENEAIQLLGERIRHEHLKVSQIQTLYYAVENPDVISILESIRTLREGNGDGKAAEA